MKHQDKNLNWLETILAILAYTLLIAYYIALMLAC